MAVLPFPHDAADASAATSAAMSVPTAGGHQPPAQPDLAPPSASQAPHAPVFAPCYEDLLNDTTRARLLAQYYAGRAYYRPDTKTWYLWDDAASVWLDERIPSHMGRFDLLCQDFLTRLSEIADREGLPLRAGPESLLSQRCLYALIRIARHQPEFRLNDLQFDADPRYLGVANGVLDLHTCTLIPSTPDMLITNRLAIPYEPNATSGLWDRVLVELTGTDADARDYRLFLREHFGAMLAGDNAKERFTIVHGPGGSGKSTFVNTIKAVLGPNALTTNHDTFSRQRAGAIREDLAAFAGKRLVVDMELPDGHRLDPSVIKMLSGRDQIRARHLYKGGAELHPTWSVVVGCNQLPLFEPAPDSGFWRRVLVLPFYRVPSKPDYELKDKLAQYHVQVAILAWLVAGLRQYRRNAMSATGSRPQRLPKAIQAACAYYRIQVDHLGYWYESCVEPAGHGDDTPTNSEVWRSYADFCAEYQVPRSAMANAVHLGRFLGEQGIGSTRAHKGRQRHGIRLVDPKRVSLASFEDDEYEYRVNLADFHV